MEESQNRLRPNSNLNSQLIPSDESDARKGLLISDDDPLLKSRDQRVNKSTITSMDMASSIRITRQSGIEEEKSKGAPMLYKTEN